MRPQVVTVTGVATSAWIPMDYKQNPFNVGVAAVISGTATYTIQHTLDDIYTNASPTAFPHATLAAQTTSKDGSYTTPVRAIRINVTASTGSVTLTLLQGQR